MGSLAGLRVVSSFKANDLITIKKTLKRFKMLGTPQSLTKQSMFSDHIDCLQCNRNLLLKRIESVDALYGLL